MRHPFDSRTGPSAAGLILVVSSVYTLLTADAASLTFRIHVLLLALVAIVALIALMKRPGQGG